MLFWRQNRGPFYFLSIYTSVSLSHSHTDLKCSAWSSTHRYFCGLNSRWGSSLLKSLSIQLPWWFWITLNSYIFLNLRNRGKTKRMKFEFYHARYRKTVGEGLLKGYRIPSSNLLWNQWRTSLVILILLTFLRCTITLRPWQSVLYHVIHA